MNAEKKLKGKSNALFCVLSLVLLVVLLFPLYWILVTSLKTEQEIFRIPPTLFPSVLNTDSYAAQLQSGDFNMFQSFWQQHDHCAELYGDRGHSFRTGLLRPGPVPL